MTLPREPSERPTSEVESESSQAAESSVDRDEIRARADRVTAQVPWIGSAWRWYDFPYRFGQWLLTGWRRRLFGWRTRQSINRWTNFFISFNDFDRQRVEALDDRMRNLLVPSDEHVQQGGLWTVELFLPSHYSQLLKALRQNGWDRDDVLRHHDGSNTEQVQRARTSHGFAWWRLGEVADPDAGFLGMGMNRERLPKEFSMIEVRAMQVGTSLTAVTAFFRLSEYGRQRLDSTWHATHEPTITLRGLRRPYVEGRHFAAIRAAQAERQRVHDVARDWLARRCPGVFSNAPGRHPVIDLTLFDTFDPAQAAPPRDLHDGLRALGLSHIHSTLFKSPQLPGLVLVPSRQSPWNYELLHNGWSAIGNYEHVIQVNERAGYGPKPYSPQTLAHMFDDEMRAFLMYVGITRYLDNLESTYAQARDVASSRHGRYATRQLQHLRRELLSTSLDLSTASRDMETLWSERWRSFSGIEVVGTEPHGLPETVRRRDDYDLIRDLGKLRKKRLKDLRADDTAYRDLLVTVASLGSSVEASRMGRRALWVAAASLAVALVALLLANTGDRTLWAELVDRIG